MTGGMVPTVQIRDRGVNNRMAATVRHNRARGVHGVLRMADLVEAMLKNGLQMGAVAALMGMEDEEVIRLASRKGIPLSDQFMGRNWSRSWEPK